MLSNNECISQLKPRPPRHGGRQRGFNTHLTTCCPRRAVELTRCLSHPGHERGFNKHAFSEKRIATGNCILFLQKQLFEGINATPFEICGFFEVSRSSIIRVLNRRRHPAIDRCLLWDLQPLTLCLSRFSLLCFDTSGFAEEPPTLSVITSYFKIY